jgi:chloramphenicol 3-O phosphotransferase
MPIQVIFLNGASSAGKSSLANALLNRLPDGWLTFGVDTLIEAMPLRLHHVPEGLTLHPDGRIDVGPAFRALEAQWRVALGAMARSGLRLVIDEVMLDGADGQAAWREALAGLEVLWVAVRCDPAVLAAREVARGDRVVGMAALQAPIVHAGVVYDLEVDTGAGSPEECARLIFDRVTAVEHDGSDGIA